MGLLVDGQWQDEWYDTTSAGGEFIRQDSQNTRASNLGRLAAVLALTCVCVLVAPLAIAQHVSLPPVNLGGTSFLDGLGGPGLLLQNSNQYYTSDRLTGSDGDALSGSNSVQNTAAVTHIALLSNIKLFGAYYGGEVFLPVVTVDVDTDFGVHGRRTGLGDLSFSPFILQWTDQTLFGRPIYQRFTLGFTVPTGSYRANRSVNLGTNVVSINPYYAFTWLIDERWETSWRFHYLWVTGNDDPSPAYEADRIQAGQAIHFNGAVSYEFTPRVRVGLAGYSLKQVTDQKIDGRTESGSKERVAGIGLGLTLQHDNGLTLTLNGYVESGAENRAEGTRLVVRLAKVF